MSHSEDYEKKLPTLQAIPDEAIKTLDNMPMATYIMEVNILYEQCQLDRDVLVGGGLSWELVTDMPVRLNALIEADVRWQEIKDSKSDVALQSEEQSKQGNRLLKIILRQMRFAFYENPQLMATLKKISKARRHDSVIQGLYNIETMGKENRSLLEKINFDFSLLDQAATTAAQMSSTLAMAQTEKAQLYEQKRLRDCAYTHLKEAVDQIYATGKWVFRDNKEHKQRYSSHYLRKKRKRLVRQNQPSPEDNQ